MKCQFKVVFKKITPHITTDFYHNTTNNTMERNLLYWIDYFTEKRQKFSLEIEMNIKSICDKCFTNYEYYTKKLMEMIESKRNMINPEDPQLIKSQNRSINHHLLRKYCNIPFNTQ